MTDLLTTPELVSETVKPKRWRNRFLLLIDGTITCRTCSFQLDTSVGDEVVLPHCLSFPSRDLAETKGQREEEQHPEKTIYLGAVAVEETP